MNTMSPLATRMCSLLAGLALTISVPTFAAEEPQPEPFETPGEPDPDAKVDDELEEVIVYATSGQLVAGLHAESELEAEGIAAYGANTVGDLLSKVAPDVDNTEQGPVILI